MKVDLEISLIHDGKQWIARHFFIEARGRTLSELDQDLARCLRESGDFPPSSEVSVCMGFDYDTIPTWLRQYAYHYFNRHILLRL
jgi:hypothetical protein